MSFINSQTDKYTVKQMCNALNFARSTYYKAPVCVPSNRKKEYEEFSQKVKQVYEDSKQRYGAVKICRKLNDEGTHCSLKRDQRHMSEQQLRSVVVKKYRHHSDHNPVRDGKENLLNRDFKAATINQKWCTDINRNSILPCREEHYGFF